MECTNGLLSMDFLLFHKNLCLGTQYSHKNQALRLTLLAYDSSLLNVTEPGRPLGLSDLKI